MADFNILGKTFTDLKGITLPDTTNTDRDFVLDGVDEPVFNIILDGDDRFVSISCNKTYSEMYDYINNSIQTAVVIHSFQDNPSNTWKESANFVGIFDSGEIRYVLFSNAIQNADIGYFENGTITFTTPSTYLETLTAIKNGTYYPSTGVFNEVTVDVPLPSGSVNITSNGTYDIKDYANVNVAVNSTVAVTEEQLPDGGIAKHITSVDISDTTAVASDVASGKYFYSANGTKTQGTASGSSFTSQKQLYLYDYDGTIVNSYSAPEALALTVLPSIPSHTGLTAQGWNWSLASIKNHLTKYPDAIVNVGQTYITNDEKTRLYVHFEEGRKSPWLQLFPNGTVEIDWGDNSAIDTLTGTSVLTIQSIQHTYAHSGDYVITFTVTGTALIQGSGATGNGSYLLQAASGMNSSYGSQVYRNAVRKIEFGSGILLSENALKNMQSLETVVIPKYITNISDYAFSNCYSLTNITIPDGATSIGNYAFNGCYTIINVSIPNTLTSILNYAFQACHSLTSITIPDGVTSIGTYVFSNCQSLTNITIPDATTGISNGVFQTCYSLTNITIPDDVTSIGSYAFSNCQSLTSITIPDGVTSIGNYAFLGCYSLTNLTIPDGVTNISSGVFSYCYSFTNIVIPDKVTNINGSAFSYCQSITNITIPDGVTNITSNAFQSCFSLTNITIPDGVTSIGNYAFQECYSLTNITIPDCVTSIGSYAFSRCYGMAEYHLLSATPPTLINTNAFQYIQSDCIIYVPQGSLEAYQTAANWSTYASYMQEESG